MTALVDRLRKLFKGEMAEREPMSEHTSFGIGGPADIYCRPKDEEDISALLRFARDEGIEVLVFGNGTNILVRDGGISGIVVHPAFRTVVLEGDELTVGSALSVSELLQFCAENSLSGLEYMAGIPGSVGGALATNSGAYGHWFGEKVSWVRAVNLDGTCTEQSVDPAEFAYRSSRYKDNMVIEGLRLQTEQEKSEVVRSRIAEYLDRRRKTQPLGEKSAGCVFKNPEGYHAGALIDGLGLKGKSRGGAEISQVHANFVVNKGGASAQDVLYLIDLARDTVQKNLGLALELEIAVVGRDSESE
jgi:UDP-N-acetylmuramate dehydrogenase